MSKLMFDAVEQYSTRHNLFPLKSKIVIGLSGGPDSVFLFHFLIFYAQTKSLSLIVAHLDHQWRTTSAEDEQFCRTLAAQHDIPYITSTATELDVTIKKNGSQEEYGRKIRRIFFEKVAHEYNANRVALAHHAQDQQETFFIRCIRGASLRGLAAMRPHMGLYVRPLLETNKSDIVTWLNFHHKAYCIDATNESELYLRNRIRTSLQVLRTADTRFDHNFAITLSRLQETDDFLEQYATTLFTTLSAYRDKTLAIDCIGLTALSGVMRCRVLMQWLIAENVRFTPTEAFFDEIMRFLRSNRGGTHKMHSQWVIVKKSGKARIQHINQ